MPIIREKNIELKKDENNINNSQNKKGIVDINFERTKPKYNLNDIILSNKVKNQLLDIISHTKYKNKVFEDWGLNEVIKSQYLAVNFYGAPGTGKTMAAHVLAKELNRELLCVNYADIESKYVGETAKNLVKLFQFSKENNLILFFDEADALLSKRVTNMNNSTDVSVNQTRSVLLMLMNDYDDMIIFTTNFISNFDEAFMRRIQYHVKFELPDMELRKLLWKRYIPSKMPNNLNINLISEKYHSISGSDISNAVRIAAFKSAREELSFVSHENFEHAIHNIVLSKNENKKEFIKERYVSEEYVKSQLNKKREE